LLLVEKYTNYLMIIGNYLRSMIIIWLLFEIDYLELIDSDYSLLFDSDYLIIIWIIWSYEGKPKND